MQLRCCGGSGEYATLDETGQTPGERRQYIKDLVGFFLCGLINNFGYVVMLSAAGHILKDSPEFPKSTVLLANILPNLALKLTAPFFMHRLPYTLRVWVVVLFGIASFQLAAWSLGVWVSLVGVMCASISAGFGEITFLAMTSYFHKNAVSAWSSGTGGAGIFGALGYLAATAWIGLTPQITLWGGSVIPLFIAVSYHLLMSKPFQNTPTYNLFEVSAKVDEIPMGGDEADTLNAHQKPDGSGAVPARLTTRARMRLLLPLLKYMIPLFFVYYAEYVINQGIAPVITFSTPLSDPKEYYVYYQFLYQAGVFVSRSSVNILPIKRIWLMGVFQVANMIFLWAHAWWLFIPSAYIVFVFIFWEGLLGGGTYVNAFFLIAHEVEPGFREFSLGVTSVADSFGIVLAGVTGLGVEPWLRDRQMYLASIGVLPP